VKKRFFCLQCQCKNFRRNLLTKCCFNLINKNFADLKKSLPVVLRLHSFVFDASEEPLGNNLLLQLQVEVTVDVDVTAVAEDVVKVAERHKC